MIAGCHPAGENVDLVADHTSGACTDDTDCSTKCDAACAGLGASYSKMSYRCEGFCNGGTNANAACTSDSQCPGGQCAGAEPVAPSHLNTCNCVCQGEGLGGASAAGSLACEVGTQINVELPSNGICGDVVPPTIALPPACGAVTSATATETRTPGDPAVPLCQAPGAHAPGAFVPWSGRICMSDGPRLP